MITRARIQPRRHSIVHRGGPGDATLPQRADRNDFRRVEEGLGDVYMPKHQAGDDGALLFGEFAGARYETLGYQYKVRQRLEGKG